MRFLAAVLIGVALVPIGPARAQDQTPRTIAPVVELEGLSYRADGQPGPTARSDAMKARRTIDELLSSDLRDLPFAVAVSGAACDGLRLSGLPDAQRAVKGLRRLSIEHPVLASPYGTARIDTDGPSRIASEIREGAETLGRCTGRQPSRILRPPAMVVPDAEGQEALADEGITNVLSDSAVPPSDERRLRVTPSTVYARSASADALIGRRPEADGLAVVLTDPDQLRDLAADERFDLVDIQKLASLDVRQGLIAPTVRVGRPERDAVDRARELLDRLRAISLAGNRLTQTLRVVLARAEHVAQTVDGTRGSPDFANNLASALQAQLRRIRIADGSVTFTSRRGSVPVTVTNETAFPVRIRVSVQSPKLTFPDGPSVVRTINPPGDTITFVAIAESSGTFPLTAVVRSPGGRLRIDRADLTVRSAAANLPVLILTIGGALFLGIVYARRIGRRRREAS